MAENEYVHDMQMISSNHWQSFFADLDSRYRGQLVSFEMDEDLLVDNLSAAKVPLLGIEYDKHMGVNISAGNDRAKTLAVKAPDLVWAAHDENGKLAAVEIVGRDGRNLILRLEP